MFPLIPPSKKPLILWHARILEDCPRTFKAGDPHCPATVTVVS
ncbi:hypothetical protein [Pontibacter sp. G13]|nr:hypothetical protein [Pontibacter sp. G13]WNJ20635.1 hypothetical protein RJD25_09135 [Pontibacter sp. G13]